MPLWLHCIPWRWLLILLLLLLLNWVRATPIQSVLQSVCTLQSCSIFSKAHFPKAHRCAFVWILHICCKSDPTLSRHKTLTSSRRRGHWFGGR
jgi:hypothetical protein